MKFAGKKSYIRALDPVVFNDRSSARRSRNWKRSNRRCQPVNAGGPKRCNDKCRKGSRITLPENISHASDLFFNCRFLRRLGLLKLLVHVNA